MMTGARRSIGTAENWTPIADPPGRYSTGIPDLDRLLGGGFGRGSMALLQVDETVGPRELEQLITPILLNFLYQSRGILAVLPARESPPQFRAHLTQWVSRRRFDTRVRVVDYVGEASEAPYVVEVKLRRETDKSDKTQALARKKIMEKFNAVESAVRGARSKMFLELVAFEIMEMLEGPEVATRMFFHGIKRTRIIGNLCLGILRPGLKCADSVRGMADMELAVHRTELGLILRGVRPAFSGHLVIPDPVRGEPHLALLPAPGPGSGKS